VLIIPSSWGSQLDGQLHAISHRQLCQRPLHVVRPSSPLDPKRRGLLPVRMVAPSIRCRCEYVVAIGFGVREKWDRVSCRHVEAKEFQKPWTGSWWRWILLLVRGGFIGQYKRDLWYATANQWHDFVRCAIDRGSTTRHRSHLPLPAASTASSYCVSRSALTHIRSGERHRSLEPSLIGFLGRHRRPKPPWIPQLALFNCFFLWVFCPTIHDTEHPTRYEHVSSLSPSLPPAPASPLLPSNGRLPQQLLPPGVLPILDLIKAHLPCLFHRRSVDSSSACSRRRWSSTRRWRRRRQKHGPCLHWIRCRDAFSKQRRPPLSWLANEFPSLILLSPVDPSNMPSPPSTRSPQSQHVPSTHGPRI
jgi:hypothetical protein